VNPVVAEARARFDINTDGALVWKAPRSVRVKPGDLAGVNAGTDRHFIDVLGRRYSARHIVYAIKHGTMPIGFVDRDGSVFDAKCQTLGRQIDHAELVRVIDYDAETGIFTWKARTSKGVRVGDSVGSKCSNGYLRAKVNGVEYLLHRLAWFHVHGEWPRRVDHINGVRNDNRIVNLRNVDARTNSENQHRAMVNNRLGVLGVCFEKQTRKFKASIRTRGRSITLGRYDSPEAAHAAYLEGKRRIHAGCTL
jgi:hypothetical protein